MNSQIMTVIGIASAGIYVWVYVFMLSDFHPNFGKVTYSIISFLGSIPATLMIMLIDSSIHFSAFIICMFVIGSLLIFFDSKDILNENSKIVYLFEGILLIILLSTYVLHSNTRGIATLL